MRVISLQGSKFFIQTICEAMLENNSDLVPNLHSKAITNSAQGYNKTIDIEYRHIAYYILCI